MSNSAPIAGGYADSAEVEADVAALEASWRAPRGRQSVLAAPPPGFTYDVGIGCPRDALQIRLDAARAAAR